MKATESATKNRDENTRKSWTFKDRWRIQGILCSLSPFHIGSGETTKHPDLTVEDVPVQIEACVKDYRGLPLISGKSLKGAVGSWLKKRIGDNGELKIIFEQAFGKGSAYPGSAAEDIPKDGEKTKDSSAKENAADTGVEEGEHGQGGAAEFHDAMLVHDRTGETPLPYWNDNTQTWVETSVGMRRDTRTAADEHLIHKECAPGGIGFRIIVTGAFDEDHAGLILAALEGFNDDRDPITLGADTASDKGRFRWEPGTVRRMDRDALRDWIENPDRVMAEQSLPELENDKIRTLRNKYAELINELKGDPEFKIILNFTDLFLVNDPSKIKKDKPDNRAKPEKYLDGGGPRDKEEKVEPGEEDKQTETEEKKDSIDHQPRVDELNRPLLPAKSFRGALRAQAERILRTLAAGCGDSSSGESGTPDFKKMYEKIACHPNSDTCCGPVREIEDLDELCLACRLFGAPGWKSPLKISDFVMTEGEVKELTQHFVAIDRFTGGGAKGAKFSARAYYRPVLEGSLSLEEKRVEKWARGLLELVFRDLEEGDITFGFGAAKGYGTCTAGIQRENADIRDDDELKARAEKSHENLMKTMKNIMHEDDSREAVQQGGDND